jgi:hypothetical protein
MRGWKGKKKKICENHLLLFVEGMNCPGEFKFFENKKFRKFP